MIHKVSYVLAEKFSKDLLETYFCKQHPPELEISFPATTFVVPKLLDTKKYSCQ